MTGGMRIGYAASFLRQFKTLPPETQKEAHEAIASFADRKNHARLKVHKLKGRLAGAYAFSVNYRTRIIFEYAKPGTAILLTVGDHDVYRD